ncbi:aldehyde dehydrogenase family protein, partial [Francisellaceae bacterium]|nr:aldehyde dehydrogenase family protein [Francisellaceae bacterium]
VPWNYPINLSIGPIAYALAAGNRVMVKMSEHTPKTGLILSRILTEAFPEGEVEIINGDIEVSKAFSNLPFDHMLFTGSTQVGRMVMRSCAENLTPVTLELGGKSPVIIGCNANIKKAAKKIAFGKLLNSGQTCIAPDYVFCPEHLIETFISAFQKATTKLYPQILTNKEYTSIINKEQYSRLEQYIEDAKTKGAQIFRQQIKNKDSSIISHNYFIPTIITNVDSDMKIMQEEIFGPILPILGYKKIDEVIQYINNHEKPLALYYFDKDKLEQDHVIQNTSSGGVTINETLMHIVQDDMPFGGIGKSGLGHYHGIEGFKTFSHAKSVHIKQKLNFTSLIYPPYGGLIQRIILKLFYK